jgi:hypothetical protein
MKTIKTVLALGALLAATAPSLAAGSGYSNPWTAAQAQSQPALQEGRASVSEPQARAVTGGEIDHLKAPIYNFVRQQ